MNNTSLIVFSCYVALLLLLPATSFPLSEDAKEGARVVTIEKLLKDPDCYNNKSILVTGTITLESEKMQISDNGQHLWLDFSGEPPYQEEVSRKLIEKITNLRKEFEGKRVRVHGVFDKKQTGHFGMWPAGIRNISTIEHAN